MRIIRFILKTIGTLANRIFQWEDSSRLDYNLSKNNIYEKVKRYRFDTNAYHIILKKKTSSLQGSFWVLRGIRKYNQVEDTLKREIHK